MDGGFCNKWIGRALEKDPPSYKRLKGIRRISHRLSKRDHIYSK